MRNENLYDRGFLVHYDDGTSSLHRTPINYIPSVADEYHTITEDETLMEIAQAKLGSQHLWYLLADINDIEDIFSLTLGDVIVIPSLDILDSIYG